MTTPSTPPTPPADLHHLEAQRRANREAIAALGFNPYGQRTAEAAAILSTDAAKAKYDASADAEYQEQSKQKNPDGTPKSLTDRRPRVTIVGRVMLSRDNGKLIWLNLRDHTGDLQVAVSQRDCKEQGFKLAKLTDLGDVLVASGRIMKTKTGEITIWADDLAPGAKCLVPPPEKHAGLTDVELRYRQRYVDLWANPETLRVFSLRSKIVSKVREILAARGFLEVETPMLQTLAGGAAARPFVTHMNALDISLFMRIAPELYLKRLLVGGMPRVYEINRNFRNEGLDKQHNPEFTMLEVYEAFGDMTTVMEITETIVRETATMVAREIDHNPLRKPIFDGGVYGGLSVGYVADTQPSYIKNTLSYPSEKWELPPEIRNVFLVLLTLQRQGIDPIQALRPIRDRDAQPILDFDWMDVPDGQPKRIDYGRPFDRVKYADLFEKALGFSMSDIARARKEARERHIFPAAAIDKIDPVLIINELFEECAEKSLSPDRPTFITHYPSAISPLTRPNREDPTVADRADLFIGHMEIAPHYTELNDPDIQEAKFKEQLTGADAEKNAEENTFRTMDHDFLRALKVGMPPAGGMGLGIDRLVMLLTNQRTIRDVVLFPLMRPGE